VTEWDATSYEGKDTILRVVRDEAERLFEMAEQPGAWEAPTACEGWKVKDIVGHLIDTTEGYFAAFETARSGGENPAAYGLPGMHERAGDQARAFGDLSPQETMARVRADLDKMMGILEPLSAEEWTGFMVPHFYMGPLPAFFYAAGQLMDYGVHSWDIRETSGRGHALSGEAADLLVPFMFVIWMYTIKPDADTSPFELGVRILGGQSAGETRVAISPEGMTLTPGSVDDLPSVLEFDASSMVLTTFGRCNTGTVRGDIDTADRFLNLFHRI
jgi:uncharacterized protein (TIGR03083 family)